MTVKIPLFTGGLENITASLGRWAAELRKLPFIFTPDFKWEKWDPTLGASSGDTYTSTRVYYANYLRVPNTPVALVHIAVTGTTGGAPTYLTFTLPFTIRSAATSIWSHCGIVDGGVLANGSVILIPGSNTVQVYKSAWAAWGNGSGREFLANFICPIEG